MEESKAKKLPLKAIAVVAVIIIAVISAVVIVPYILSGGLGNRVSINKASLSWQYNSFDQNYYVSAISVELTNNGRDQIFNLYVEAKGNWPVEYEGQRGLHIAVGAGLNPSETRTISRSGIDLAFQLGGNAATKQTGTYTVTLQVVKYKYNDSILAQVEDVYGEYTITTHVP